MNGKRYFFRHVAMADLTGEQLRVLMCMLSAEVDGDIGILQKEIGALLGLSESNVSRSIKALIDANILSKTTSKGFDKRTIWKIEPAFEQRERLAIEPF